MKRYCLFLSALCAATVFAAPITIDLEWNCRNDVSIPREIAIDRTKLDKLAGIPQDSALEVIAVTPTGEMNTNAITLAGNTPGKDILRFTVPEKTYKLYARVTGSKKKIACANSSDNIVAGILETTKNWKYNPKYFKVYRSGKNLRIDMHQLGWTEVFYTQDLPEGFAGTPAVFEVELKSCTPLVWGGGLKVKQFTRDGKLLPESLTEPRWISHMRVPGVKTHYIEYGFFHPDAAKIAVTIEFAGQRFMYDNYGRDLKDASACMPKLEISKAAIRKAGELPFPAYNNDLFPDGVSDAPGDHALALDGSTIFHYSPNTHSVYSESKQIQSVEQCFWPFNDATVEMWIKPRWGRREKREFVFIDARNNYGPRPKVIRQKIGSLFMAKYIPAKSEWRMTIFDGEDKAHEFSFKHQLARHKWVHLAFQYGKDGIEVFENGKIIYRNDKYSFRKREIKKQFKPNDQIAQLVSIGNTGTAARGRMVNAPAAHVDQLRITENRRYTDGFTPDKNYGVDDKTVAFFSFDRDIDGKSCRSLGRIYGSLNSTTKFLRQRKFVCNSRMVNYFPGELLAENNPDVVLNKLNYPVMPSVSDFKAARKESVVKYTAKPGERKELTVPAKSYMNYIEISCPDDVKELYHPVLIANDELDTRSFGDIAESLNAAEKSGKERVNILFNLVLGASDYFMTNQIAFPAHTDTVRRGDYRALTLLNSYCGFECGPLNNMAANMFSCAGLLPATQTSGYGHSFQQVYFDGKNHVYDLSAQRFFPALDNETSASLKELDRENGSFQRYGSGGASFVRQGFTRGYARHVPGMQRRVAYILHPGEKARFYFYNDGNYNDLQNKRCIDPNAVHPNDPFPYPLEYRIAKVAPEEVVAKETVYQVHRPFPHYSNGYFTFSGKPSKENAAFTRITDKDFCYLVDMPYPIVRASYKAVTTDGKAADIEISTDGAKSFRKLVTDKDGIATYAVRAREAYYIKIKAPIGKIAKFDAMTEVMFNSRVQNCKLKEGRNSILFKADKSGRADITISYRSDAKEIVIKDAPCNGAMPGSERQITAVEPGKSVTHEVTGVSGKAQVRATSGIEAKLAGNQLVITAKKDGGATRFESVTISDDGAEKELTVLVSDKVRMVLAKEASNLTNGAKLVKANEKCVQDCVVVNNAGQRATFNFSELPAGDYTIWVLSRMNTDDVVARISRNSRNYELTVVMPDGTLVPAVTGINSGNELYKARYGKGKGRFRWDARLDNDHNKYPYFSPRWTTLGKSSSITIQANRKQEIEVAAILITPRTGNATRSELVKVLCGLNCEPWKVAEFQKR